MMVDDRKPTGVRITTSEADGRVTFYMNRTAKKSPEQNSPHTAIKPLKTNILKMPQLDPTKIGEAVLTELGIDKDDKSGE